MGGGVTFTTFWYVFLFLGPLLACATCTLQKPAKGLTNEPITDSLSPNAPPLPAVSRSTSPSSGFTQFLLKPSKRFSHSVSGSKAPTRTSETRPSMTSAGGRKHKISRPIDPRLGILVAPASECLVISVGSG